MRKLDLLIVGATGWFVYKTWHKQVKRAAVAAPVTPPVSEHQEKPKPANMEARRRAVATKIAALTGAGTGQAVTTADGSGLTARHVVGRGVRH